MNYTPPTPADLQRLKLELGCTGNEMAELAGVGGGSQWRKYTGGADPRTLSPHMAFWIAARLVLTADQLAAVAAKMREMGAGIDGDALAWPPVADFGANGDAPPVPARDS